MWIHGTNWSRWSRSWKLYVGNTPTLQTDNPVIDQDTGKGHQIEQVYVQDPTFNCLDQQFLESLGYTVLPTPNALEAMTPTTFLFDPHLEWKHSASALEKAHPSFRIGNSLTTFSVW